MVLEVELTLEGLQRSSVDHCRQLCKDVRIGSELAGQQRVEITLCRDLSVGVLNRERDAPSLIDRSGNGGIDTRGQAQLYLDGGGRRVAADLFHPFHI